MAFVKIYVHYTQVGSYHYQTMDNMQLVINPTQNINVNLQNTFARQNLKQKKWLTTNGVGTQVGYFESKGEQFSKAICIFYSSQFTAFFFKFASAMIEMLVDLSLRLEKVRTIQ